MNEVRLMQILQAPHVSEKSSMNQAYRQYIFKVIPDANKIEIREAVEHLFKVKVRTVRVLNTKGKATRFKQVRGHRSGWKKAYVTLVEGSEIEIAGE